jgi:hypothetical protein
MSDQIPLALRFSVILLIFVCSYSQGLATEPSVGDEMPMSGVETTRSQNPLFVDPRGTQKERTDFIQALSHIGKNNRQLIEFSLPVIGANGVLDGMTSLWPKCHSEAHDVGKVIFAHVRDISIGMRVCADRCNSGCMHGVLMEAFTTIGKASPHHMDVAILGPAIKDLCQSNPVMTASYSPGDCAHGVGHALMNLARYEIPDALKGCHENDSQAMEYYCATGAYMEYVTERDEQDATTKGLLYPCDKFVYPAACARYKMVHVVRRHYKEGKTTEELRTLCSSFADPVRRGCFHGLGNAHMPMIAVGKIGIRSVCLGLSAVEEFVCIDGAIERMAKFFPRNAARVCQDLDENNKGICLTAVSRKMYDTNKDLSVYLDSQ